MIIPPFPREARPVDGTTAPGWWRIPVTACSVALLATTLAWPAVAATPGTNLPHRIVKWTDADGRVHYGDRQPLPRRAVTVHGLDSRQAGAQTDAMASTTPPASPRARPITTTRTFSGGRQPVTLFTTADCDACELGEAWLTHRGVSYERKDVANPADALAFQAHGFENLHFPALAVGADKLTGFDMEAWNRTLAAGGYPAASPEADPEH